MELVRAFVDSGSDPVFSVAGIDAGDPRRAALEAFIAAGYARSYGARVTQFADRLIGVTNAAGRYVAGLGYTLAEGRALYLERYLDAPIEAAISARLGVAVTRTQVVEVGNFTATAAGAARHLIYAMAEFLHRLDRAWVVFTATRALLNAFARLEIAPIALAAADPARLSDGGASWGSYYATRPQVMAGNVALGYIHMRSRHGDARVL
ncbi:MAG: thermostable hemolysin [Burkholderiales bacterium]|nr:thermostable hemolysin [Burkholderiales bacterium]